MDSVIAQLKQRFQHVDQLASFSHFDFSHHHTKIRTYGDEEVKMLCALYRHGDTPGVDVAALKAEWEDFRFLMLQTYSQNTMKDMLKVLVADGTILSSLPLIMKTGSNCFYFTCKHSWVWEGLFDYEMNLDSPMKQTDNT